MRRWILTAGVLGALLSLGLPGVSSPPPLQKLRIAVRILSGDPLGNREDGTLKVDGEPRFLAVEGKSARYWAGGQAAIKCGEGEVVTVPFGLMVACKAKLVPQGQVYLDLTFERSLPPAAIPNTPKGSAFLHSARARLLGTYLLGEVVKLPLEGRPAHDQVWVEVIVTKVN